VGIAKLFAYVIPVYLLIFIASQIPELTNCSSCTLSAAVRVIALVRGIVQTPEIVLIVKRFQTIITVCFACDKP